MHLSDQDLKAYFTADDSDPEVIRIGNHLTECPECQARADQLSQSGAETSRHMSILAPDDKEAAQPAHQAYARFERQYLEQQDVSKFERLFKRKYRFAWAAVGVVAVLAVAMLFPQVRAIGSSFLGLFRVEQFTIIQIDPENHPLPEFQPFNSPNHGGRGAGRGQNVGRADGSVSSHLSSRDGDRMAQNEPEWARRGGRAGWNASCCCSWTPQLHEVAHGR